MEVFEMVLQAISNYGFPIAACIGMFWYMNKEREAHQQEVKDMTTALNNNTLKTTEALDKNTAVIERLMDKVGD